MPDLSGLALLLVIGGAAAALIAAPLRRRTAGPDPDGQPGDELEYRYRAALEALRDVETDRRAGSLDEAAYAREREAAEAHAARTLAELEAAESGSVPDTGRQPVARKARRLAAVTGSLLGLLLLAGFVVPANTPASLAQPVRTNQPLADALAAEEARQATIARMLDRFRTDPSDAEALRSLADAYLASGSDDLPRAAAVLLLLIDLQPENVEALADLAGAYLRAGDLANGQAAVDRLAQIAPDSADLAFLRGLLAFERGENELAVTYFDRFLELAPDDPRAAMLRSLRAEAAGELPSG